MPGIGGDKHTHQESRGPESDPREIRPLRSIMRFRTSPLHRLLATSRCTNHVRQQYEFVFQVYDGGRACNDANSKCASAVWCRLGEELDVEAVIRQARDR